MRVLLAVCLLAAGLRLWPHAPLAQSIGNSRAVYAQGGELLRLTLAPDQQYRLWVPLARMSPRLTQAVLLYEDRRFYMHPGVDPAALLRSAWHTATGVRRQGGSTLSMQLARRLYGIDSRGVGGKLRQMGAALWLEARHGKSEILEAYLNTAPYGGNIEGVQAASRIYFGKDAAALSVPEALTLAVVPQNPVQRMAKGGHGPELQAARQRLWALWAARDAQALRHAPELPLRLAVQPRGSLPFAAPHLTDMLLAQDRLAPVIRSSIDLRMQSTLERVMAQYLRAHSGAGVNNASALLLDASTMQVRALIGSGDWSNAAISGQVNGSQAKRSPGSTLKPFIYALALDQGLIHPLTMLKDTPTSFGPFTPENFDNRFAGPLSAQEALIRSRNVPAVALAARLSRPTLYDFMRLGGVARMQSESHYGLALVLGGGEVTPEELAGLYAVLANGGLWQPLRYTDQPGDPLAASSRRLLSEEASFITLDMLRHSPRPDTGEPAQPPVAWKTGTSWGFRDAWTAGVFGGMVLVVWVGNFDGSSNPALVGVDAAAPLFVRMVDALRAEGLAGGETAAPAGAALRRVEVCAATGGLTTGEGALCPVRATTWFIAGKSPIQPSRLHRAAWVDARSGKAVCAGDPHALQNVVEQWDSDVHRLFRQAGLPRRAETARDCHADGEPGTAQAAPLITSPLRGVRYTLQRGKPAPIVLRADAAPGIRSIYWFADNALVARVAPGVGVAWAPPAPGTYLMRAVDDSGRAESREVTVELLP